MIQANELRLNNLLLFDGKTQYVSSIQYDNTIRLKFNPDIASHGCYKTSDSRIKQIPLTEEILLKCPNHKKVNGKNILNTIYFEIGRDRIISIGNIGTPNEMIWLCEVDRYDKQKNNDLVCLHNYDYDGKMMLHKFQNLYFALSNEELKVNL